MVTNTFKGWNLKKKTRQRQRDGIFSVSMQPPFFSSRQLTLLFVGSPEAVRDLKDTPEASAEHDANGTLALFCDRSSCIGADIRSASRLSVVHHSYQNGSLQLRRTFFWQEKVLSAR